MVSPTVSDIELSNTISKVKTKLISSCGEYISSESMIGKLFHNRVVQLIVPYILLIASLYIAKPEWVLDPETQTRNMSKIILMATSLYLAAIFLILVVKSYVSPTRTLGSA